MKRRRRLALAALVLVPALGWLASPAGATGTAVCTARGVVLPDIGGYSFTSTDTSGGWSPALPTPTLPGGYHGGWIPPDAGVTVGLAYTLGWAFDAVPGVTVACSGTGVSPEADFTVTLAGGLLAANVGDCTGNAPLPDPVTMVSRTAGANCSGSLGAMAEWYSADAMTNSPSVASGNPAAGGVGLYDASWATTAGYWLGTDGSATATLLGADPVAAAFTAAQGSMVGYVVLGVGLIVALLLAGIGVGLLVRYTRRSAAAA